MRRVVLGMAVGVVMTGLTGCESAGPMRSGEGPQTSVQRVRGMLVGAFSSAAQHAADPSNFAEIELRICEIWPARDDGPWLYVEQAAADARERPYRQRVYRLSPRDDGSVDSVVYELPGDPLQFAGACEDAGRFEDLLPTVLRQKEGCTVHLRPRWDGAFVGGTVGLGCESALRGAAYATSQVTLTADEMSTWDRGFDAAGKHVWGSTKGPYVFSRMDAPSARR